MPKKIMNDIIVNKKSIRQVSISKEKLDKKKLLEEEKEKDLNISEPISLPRRKRSTPWQRKRINPKFAIWFLALLCAVSLLFGISMIFSSATVTITPKTEIVNFANEVYTADLGSQKTNNLVFETINTKKSLGEAIEAGEEKEVNQKASGKIIIYNNYDANPQRLINNTRFESADGRIYRINTSVVIPGMKKVDGKLVPGSVEALVYADQAGESYNLSLADLKGDFTIPGFKGDPRHAKFYARLKEDIKGGFIGKQRVVSEELRAQTIESLKLKLKEQLLKEIYAIKPESYLLFTDHYSILYTNLPDTAIESDKVEIKIEGTIFAVVFDKIKLAKFINQKKELNLTNDPTEFIPGEDIAVSIVKDDNTNIAVDKSLKINLNGSATIKWIYDANQLKKDLAGKKESDLKSLMLKYDNSISNMSLSLRPVWGRYVPDNLEKIKIKENKI